MTPKDTKPIPIEADGQEPQAESPCTAVSRRRFLETAAMAAAGTSFLMNCTQEQREAWIQRRYRELTKKELAQVISRLEREYEKKYKKKVKVGNEPPMDGVVFGYALDISRCVGCRRCVYGCVKENNQSRDPQVHWIKVLEMEKEHGVDVYHSNCYYNPDIVPREGQFYMPVQCNQCKNPPCTKVCPVSATWSEPDGIVVIDYNWCIGCRYCMAACPYGARHFNWSSPQIPSDTVNPDTHYLGNRPRVGGVVEKCTFCIQRARKGLYPACVEVCPIGVRKFGNLLDPEGEIRYILENKRVFLLKEDLNTQPKFFYYYGI